MHTPSQDDTLLNKWREIISCQKADVIAAFLDEYGEQANWDDGELFYISAKRKVFSGLIPWIEFILVEKLFSSR